MAITCKVTKYATSSHVRGETAPSGIFAEIERNFSFVFDFRRINPPPPPTVAPPIPELCSL